MERNVVFIALFAALIAVLGFIPAITLGSGVPITAQTLGVMLCGTVLGSWRGALAVLLFLGLVYLGLPLLAGGRGGPAQFSTPSVGFLIGWPVAAFVTGLIVEKVRALPLTIISFIASLLGCVVVLYVFGIAGMAFKLEKPLIEASYYAIPYLLPDALKTLIAGFLTGALYKARPNSLFSRAQSQAAA